MLLPAWKNAARELFEGQFTFGDVVPHDALHAAFRLPEPKDTATIAEYKEWGLKVLGQMTALTEYLLEEKSMCLRALPGVGYEIVPPAKQTEYAEKEGWKQVRSGLRKMQRRLAYVDRSQLTHEQARANADAMAKAGALKQMISQAKRLKLAAPPEVKEIGKD